jgi:hypothetical protein
VTSLSPATVGRAGAAPVGSGVSLIEAATLEARLALLRVCPADADLSTFGQIGADSFELFLVDPLDAFDLVGVVDDFGSNPSSPATSRNRPWNSR